MASTNVAKFAAELKMPPEGLLEQLKAAGLGQRSPDDELTEADKEQLLLALRRAHGADEGAKRRITLTLKQTSEIKQADATGKARTIQVEVRKKRVFVKRDSGDSPAVELPAAEPVQAPAPMKSVVAEEQQRLREAEDARQRELLERQAADLREKQERLEREREREIEAAAEAQRREEEARREAERAAAIDVAAHSDEREQVQADAKAAGEAARKAAEDAEDQARARKAVEDEVAEINRLMSLQRKPQPKPAEVPIVARAPTTAPGAAAPAGAAGQGPVSGTLHRPAGGARAAPGAATVTDGQKKHVKSEKLSSTWSDEAAKKRGIKTRGVTSDAGWRGAKGGGRHRGGAERHEAVAGPQAVSNEPVVREVHVPETI
ncbi:MAG: translation initiation factor IF-2 associated domain-containing protein, partial [Burkholderiaceae bacterium]|nr:translation initiation factor IF-2 associated domain-containing protein [Burkholderiaceae bacterium]